MHRMRGKMANSRIVSINNMVSFVRKKTAPDAMGLKCCENLQVYKRNMFRRTDDLNGIEPQDGASRFRQIAPSLSYPARGITSLSLRTRQKNNGLEYKRVGDTNQ